MIHPIAILRAVVRDLPLVLLACVIGVTLVAACSMTVEACER